MDHNGTTPLHPAVKEVIIESLDKFGNPSSLHSYGREGRELVEQARESIASFIGATPAEIVFVGSGTEANNTVLNNLNCGSKHCSFRSQIGDGLITSKIEHPCIMETAKCLRDRGIPVKYLDVDRYGKIIMDQLKSYITDGIRLVSVMMANNEIGTIQDIKTIARLCHEHNVLIHTDAAQAVGKIPVDIKDLGVDFLTISGHKVYGPKGVGALYINRAIPFCPFIHGGHQEKGRRAGTENTLGIIAFGRAIEMRNVEMEQDAKRLLHLKMMLRYGLEQSIADINFNGHPEDCLPNTLNISFDGAEGEALQLYLDMEGIAVSTGSACASGSLAPSHVLLATGLSPEQAHGSIRISLGRDNTEEDVGYAIAAFKRVVDKVRKISSAYKHTKD